MSIVELYYDAYLETLPDFFCSLLTTNDVVPLCMHLIEYASFYYSPYIRLNPRIVYGINSLALNPISAKKIRAEKRKLEGFMPADDVFSHINVFH